MSQWLSDYMQIALMRHIAKLALGMPDEKACVMHFVMQHLLIELIRLYYGASHILTRVSPLLLKRAIAQLNASLLGARTSCSSLKAMMQRNLPHLTRTLASTLTSLWMALSSLHPQTVKALRC